MLMLGRFMFEPCHLDEVEFHAPPRESKSKRWLSFHPFSGFFFEKVAFAEALEVNLRVRTRRRSRTRQTQRMSSGVWKLGHHRALSAALWKASRWVEASNQRSNKALELFKTKEWIRTDNLQPKLRAGMDDLMLRWGHVSRLTNWEVDDSSQSTDTPSPYYGSGSQDEAGKEGERREREEGERRGREGGEKGERRGRRVEKVWVDSRELWRCCRASWL